MTLLDQLILECLLKECICSSSIFRENSKYLTGNVIDSPLGLSDDFMADRAVVGSGSEGLLLKLIEVKSR